MRSWEEYPMHEMLLGTWTSDAAFADDDPVFTALVDGTLTDTIFEDTPQVAAGYGGPDGAHMASSQESHRPSKRPRTNTRSSENVFDLEGGNLGHSDSLLAEISSIFGTMGVPVLQAWFSTHQKLPDSDEMMVLQSATGASQQRIQGWFESQVRLPMSVSVTESNPQQGGATSDHRHRRRRRTMRQKGIRNTENGNLSRSYCCISVCVTRFEKKGDWKRHMESHYFVWICGGPDCFKEYSRRDKLLRHVRLEHHALESGASAVDRVRIPVEDIRAYQCGFCGDFWHDFDQWIQHVAEHFENTIPGGPWRMSHWRIPWVGAVEEEASQPTPSTSGTDSETASSSDSPYPPDDPDMGPDVGGGAPNERPPRDNQKDRKHNRRSSTPSARKNSKRGHKEAGGHHYARAMPSFTYSVDSEVASRIARSRSFPMDNARRSSEPEQAGSTPGLDIDRAPKDESLLSGSSHGPPAALSKWLNFTDSFHALLSGGAASRHLHNVGLEVFVYNMHGLLQARSPAHPTGVPIPRQLQEQEVAQHSVLDTNAAASPSDFDSWELFDSRNAERKADRAPSRVSSRSHLRGSRTQPGDCAERDTLVASVADVNLSARLQSIG